MYCIPYPQTRDASHSLDYRALGWRQPRGVQAAVINHDHHPTCAQAPPRTDTSSIEYNKNRCSDDGDVVLVSSDSVDFFRSLVSAPSRQVSAPPIKSQAHAP